MQRKLLKNISNVKSCYFSRNLRSTYTPENAVSNIADRKKKFAFRRVHVIIFIWMGRVWALWHPLPNPDFLIHLPTDGSKILQPPDLENGKIILKIIPACLSIDLNNSDRGQLCYFIYFSLWVGHLTRGKTVFSLKIILSSGKLK